METSSLRTETKKSSVTGTTAKPVFNGVTKVLESNTLDREAKIKVVNLICLLYCQRDKNYFSQVPSNENITNNQSILALLDSGLSLSDAKSLLDEISKIAPGKLKELHAEIESKLIPLEVSRNNNFFELKEFELYASIHRSQAVEIIEFLAKITLTDKTQKTRFMDKLLQSLTQLETKPNSDTAYLEVALEVVGKLEFGLNIDEIEDSQTRGNLTTKLRTFSKSIKNDSIVILINKTISALLSTAIEEMIKGSRRSIVLQQELFYRLTLAEFNPAFKEGEAQALKVYIRQILDSHLQQSDQVEILVAKNEQGNSGFYCALTIGHLELVKTYTKLVLESKLSVMNKQKLLFGRDKEGVPGIYHALDRPGIAKEFYKLILYSNGFTSIEKVQILSAGYTNVPYEEKFVEALRGIKDTSVAINLISLILGTADSLLSIEHKAKLLNAKNLKGDKWCTQELIDKLRLSEQQQLQRITADNEKVAVQIPAIVERTQFQELNPQASAVLSEALISNNVETTKKVVVEILDNKLLTIDERVKILQARNKDGTPVFNLALREGYSEAVQVFIKAVLDANEDVLSKENKLSLLEAKDRDGTPGLYWALRNGHSEAVQVFIEGVLLADENVLSKEDKLSLLQSKDSYGTPGFMLSLQNGYAGAIREFITLILNADNSILTPTNKFELLLAKSSGGFPGFFMALLQGHTGAIKEFVNLILKADSSILTPTNKFELLLAKSSDGLSGVWVALLQGHAGAIKEFVTLILNADNSILTPSNKLELLLTKDSNGYPGFFVALMKGHIGAIKEFVTLILNVDNSILTPTNKLELLLAKDSDGYPGFHWALYDGHIGAIKEFVTLILNADSSILTSANKLELLLAKSSKGTPGFYLALQEGHIGAIKEFVTLILNADSSILSPANKLELLLAKSSKGTPGFYLALQEGHVSAIKVFITLILNADSSVLTPTNKLELLLAKASDGTPGFCVALLQGHISAIKEFVTLILNADSNILTPANKLELLLAKRSNGTPGFCVALLQDHADAIKEFATLILNADDNVLTSGNKLELLLAKDKYGNPGLYLALKNDNVAVVEQYVSQILASNSLGSKDKVELLLAANYSDKDGQISSRYYNQAFNHFVQLIYSSNLTDEEKRIIITIVKDKDLRESYANLHEFAGVQSVESIVKSILEGKLLTPEQKMNKLHYKNINDTPWLSLAVLKDNDEIIKEFVELTLKDKLDINKKLELLRAVDSNGKTCLYYALIGNHPKASSKFTELIMSSNDLSIDDKLCLISFTDERDKEILMSEFNLAKKDYIQMILDNSQITNESKISLLSVKYPNGGYLLNQLLKVGETELVKKFVQLVFDCDALDINEKLGLLKAPDRKGKTALYHGLAEKHDKATKMFIKLIMSSDDLSIDDKLYLISFTDERDKEILMSDFNLAKKEYIQMVLDSPQITNEIKISLLLVKSPNGDSLLNQLLKVGETELVKKFIHVVFDCEELDINEKLYLLKASDGKGKTALYHGFAENRDTAIKAFIELIMSSKDLCIDDKLYLISFTDERDKEMLMSDFNLVKKEYIQIVLDSPQITNESKISLLSVKSPNGGSLLNQLLKVGETELVKKFVQLVFDCEELEINDKLDLLKAPDGNGKTALYHGLAENRDKATKTFIELIMLSDDLSIDDKLYLISFTDEKDKEILMSEFNLAKKEYIQMILASSQITNESKISLLVNESNDPNLLVQFLSKNKEIALARSLEQFIANLSNIK